MTINLYFVRHGRTDFNVSRIIQGQGGRGKVPDMPLNEEGMKQAESVCHVLEQNQIPCDLVLSSPLLRAYQTGQHIANHYNVDIVTNNGLREMFFGTQWEGMPVDDLKKLEFNPPHIVKNAVNSSDLVVKNGEMLRKFHKSTDPQYDLLNHPGGETKQEVHDRVKKALVDFINTHREIKNICIPCHNAMLRFLLSSIDRKSAAESVGHTEIVHITYDPERDQWKLIKRIKNTY